MALYPTHNWRKTEKSNIKIKKTWFKKVVLDCAIKCILLITGHNGDVSPENTGQALWNSVEVWYSSSNTRVNTEYIFR